MNSTPVIKNNTSVHNELDLHKTTPQSKKLYALNDLISSLKEAMGKFNILIHFLYNFY